MNVSNDAHGLVLPRAFVPGTRKSHQTDNYFFVRFDENETDDALHSHYDLSISGERRPIGKQAQDQRSRIGSSEISSSA